MRYTRLWDGDRQGTVDFETHSFRLAAEILEDRQAWHELRVVLRDISQADIVTTHMRIAREREERGRRAPAGGQTAVNAVFDERLQRLGWRPEPLLFGGDPDLAAWAMDFIKERVGVEVSFNHSEAIPWTLTRLTLAGESTEVIEENRVDVGVAIYATGVFKSWSRMDSAVGTFDRARLWLEQMRPVLPVPILMVGLVAASNGVAWSEDATDAWRGTRSFDELFEDWQTRQAAEDTGTFVADKHEDDGPD